MISPIHLYIMIAHMIVFRKGYKEKGEEAELHKQMSGG